MAGNLQRDPVAGVGVGKRDAVMEVKRWQFRQALQQQGEGHFQLSHGLVGLQGLQALPEHAQPIEPEHRAGEAGFELKHQVGVMALGKTLLITPELVGSRPAQGCDPFVVGVRITGQRQPGQGSIQAQGACVSGVLA